MKYLKILLGVAILAFAFTIGHIIDDIPILQLNPEVRAFEPLTFLLTLIIGLLIPFFIKRWIDDSRQVKNNLIDELKDSLFEVLQIREKIKVCFTERSISAQTKQDINIMFEQSDFKINCLEVLLTESFDKETKEIRDGIKACYLDYWKLLTGAEVMSNDFVNVNENFYNRQNISFSKFEMEIKKAVYKIHKL
jgi:hypothetical protein